ncbi:unnamed protein product, partial [Scytosiphon promiscuus]
DDERRGSRWQSQGGDGGQRGGGRERGEVDIYDFDATGGSSRLKRSSEPKRQQRGQRGKKKESKLAPRVKPAPSTEERVKEILARTRSPAGRG